MSQLDISVVQRGDISIVAIVGPLDSYTSTEFNATIMQLIEAGHRKLVVDLAGMTMITSAGIGELAGAFNDLDDLGGELRLAAVPEQAARAMEQLALLDMFQTFVNSSDASVGF